MDLDPWKWGQRSPACSELGGFFLEVVELHRGVMSNVGDSESRIAAGVAAEIPFQVKYSALHGLHAWGGGGSVGYHRPLNLESGTECHGSEI